MAMVLPTVFNLAIPTNVFIGGPPTISMMGMAFKAAFKILGKFAKSGLFKRIRQRLFRNLNPGFLKCAILRAEPVNILTGEVSLEHEDFVLPGRIPIEWSRVYSSESSHDGLCGHGWESLPDTRLEVDDADGVVTMRHPTVGPLFFSRLPDASADAGELELADGALLTDHGDEYRVRTKDDRVYGFPKRLARTNGRGAPEYPIGSITDLCGNWLRFDYQNGTLTGIDESAGRRIDVTISRGRITEAAVTLPASNFRYTFARYQYDAAGDLVAVLDPLGNPYRFEYDHHRMVRHTNRNSLSFFYEYDKTSEQWRVIHSWGDGGLYDYRFQYDDLLDERRITDSLGGVTIVKLDERGLPIAEIDTLGGMTVYEYDEAGRTTVVVDPAGHRTQYHYDEAGNLLKLVRPDGLAVTTVFNAQHKPIRITAENGGDSHQRWDERGLLVEQITPLGHVTHYEYDSRGQLVSKTNPRGAVTRLRFDAFGNVAEVIDASGHRMQVTHDTLGQLLTKQDALGRRTHYQYDAKCRLASATQPSGSTIVCAYDAADNLTAFTDESGATTRLEYVDLAKVSRRLQPDGEAVEFRYDTEQRLVGVSNQRNEKYEFRRDALGRITEEIDYWGQSWRYAYDPAGNLIESSDPLGQQIQYTCDALGRISQKWVRHRASAAPRVETFVYTAMGDVVEAANEHVTVTREFDADGQLTKEMQTHRGGQRFAIENTYDAQRNRLKRTTTDSTGGTHTVEFGFDLLDQISSLSVDGGTPVRVQHDALGRMTREDYGPDLIRELQYDADGQLAQQSMFRAGERLFGTQYEYDPAGHLTRRRDTEFGDDSYIYNPMGRILQHIDPHHFVHRFLTDQAGDRLVTHVVRGSRVRGGTSRADGWRREGQLNKTQWRFDRAGNLILRRDSEQRLELTWDAHQRLVASRRSQQSGEEVETTYAYDPLGRRLFKETAGQRTWFGWDGDAMCFEATDGVSREFVYRPETFEPLALIATSTLIYVNDPNGCPTRLIDQHGNVQWSANFSMVGRAEITNQEAVQNPIRLQNQYADPETQLLYNRHRYFDADLGQFVSQDPVRLIGGSHIYAYAPNPIGWTDPLGLNPACRMTGRAVVNASDLPIVRPGTRAWNEAVAALRRTGRGDIRVETIQDAKALLREARGNMDRRRNYTPVSYNKGYEVHNTHNAASRAREMAVGNDMRHIKWQEGTSKADWSEGHIFFGNVF
jgi:RHS repeat-associated protein